MCITDSGSALFGGQPLRDDNLLIMSIEASSNQLYAVISNDAGTSAGLYVCDPLGCTIKSQLVGSGLFNSGGYTIISVDDSGPYWTDTTQTKIQTSGATLATAPNKVTAITTDETAVYWGDNVGGVYKVAKP
jgi:hypothetical protein